MKLPKNIATMTDAKHWKWLESLSSEDYDEVARKTYIVCEYEIRVIDEHGDAIDLLDTCTTAAEARASFAACKIERDHALVLEKVKTVYSAADRLIDTRNYETIQTKGSKAALRAGGWID